jgi:hypothetical protein
MNNDQETVLEVCDYNHLLLYAKDHYQRSSDVIADVKTILLHRIGHAGINMSDELMWDMLKDALLEYDHHRIYQFLSELFRPMADETGYSLLTQSADSCPLVRAVRLVLRHLAMVRVEDHNGVKFLELGDPDPGVLPLKAP